MKTAQSGHIIQIKDIIVKSIIQWFRYRRIQKRGRYILLRRIGWGLVCNQICRSYIIGVYESPEYEEKESLINGLVELYAKLKIECPYQYKK